MERDFVMDHSIYQLMPKKTARCQQLFHRLHPGQVWSETSCNTQSPHVEAMFGPDTIEYINIPTYNSHKMMSGCSEDDIISFILHNMKHANLAAKDLTQFKHIIDSSVPAKRKKMIYDLHDIIVQLADIFEFDDNSVMAYRKMNTIIEQLIDRNAENHTVSVLRALNEITSCELERFETGITDNLLHLAWTSFYENLLKDFLVLVNMPDQYPESRKKYQVLGYGRSRFDFTMEIDLREHAMLEAENRKKNKRPRQDHISSDSNSSGLLTGVGPMKITTNPDLTACIVVEHKVDRARASQEGGENNVEVDDTVRTIYPVLMVQMNAKLIPRKDLHANSAPQSLRGCSDGNAGHDEAPGDKYHQSNIEKSHRISQELKKPCRVGKRSYSHAFGSSGDSSHSCDASDNNDQTFNKIRRQHLFELVAAMKLEKDSKSHYSGVSKTFGLLIIKNKVFLTCLKISSRVKDYGKFKSKRIREFAAFTKSSQYVENNRKTGGMFKYMFSDYLNIFNPVHFRVLLLYIAYIFDHEEKENVDIL